MDLWETGLNMKFETAPGLYEDRVMCKELDLGHTKPFVNAMQFLLGVPHVDEPTSQESGAQYIVKAFAEAPKRKVINRRL